MFPTDNRTFARMRQDAIAYIEQQRGQWTDENASDPGIMLLEALLYEIELQQYAFSQQTIAAQWQLLQSLRIERQPLERTEVVATLHRRHGRVWRGQRFLAGTLSFEVGRTSDIIDNDVSAIYVADRFAWRRIHRSETIIEPFHSSDTVYFCFAQPLKRGEVIDLYLAVDAGEWRYWNGATWTALHIQSETTMSHGRLIRFTVADDCTTYALEGQRAEWLIAYRQTDRVLAATCSFPVVNAVALQQQRTYYRAYTLVCPAHHDTVPPFYSVEQLHLCLVQRQEGEKWRDIVAVVQADGAIHFPTPFDRETLVRFVVSDAPSLWQWETNGLPYETFHVPMTNVDRAQWIVQVRLAGEQDWCDWHVMTAEQYAPTRETLYWSEANEQLSVGDGRFAKVPRQGAEIRVVQAVASLGAGGHIKQGQVLIEQDGVAVAHVCHDARNGQNEETLMAAKERLLTLWQTTYVAFNEQQWLSLIREEAPQRYDDVAVVLNERWTGTEWRPAQQTVAIIVELPQGTDVQEERWLAALEQSRPLNVELQLVPARRIVVALYCQLATSGAPYDVETLRHQLNDELHLGSELDYRFVAHFLRQYAQDVVLQEMTLVPRYHLKRNRRGDWEIAKHDSLYVEQFIVEWVVM